MRYLLLILVSLTISGCQNKSPLTPQEQEEQETRMRAFLNESSPRNMNQLPKVAPELKRSFNMKNSSVRPKEPQEETLSDQQDSD